MDLAANPFTHAIAARQKQIGLWISLSSHFAATQGILRALNRPPQWRNSIFLKVN